MDLYEYCWRKKLSLADCHRATKINKATLSNIYRRKATPNLLTALKIHSWSQGEIEIYSLLSQDDETFIKSLKFPNKS